MEKSANSIGKTKFQKLSSLQQHKLLAQFARDSLANGRCDAFLARYQVLHQWAEIDKYLPPTWLTAREAVFNCGAFHELFASQQNSIDSQDAPVWNPRHQVEVVVDQVQTPFNLGSILRLIDNLGFEGLVHSAPWQRWDHPRLKKSARGAQAWIPVEFQPNLPEYLACSEVPVIGLEVCEGAVPLSEWKPPRACKLVLGNEVNGLAQAVRNTCHQMVSVPMFGFKNSMNVSHAFAVVAYFWLNFHAMPCMQIPGSS